MSKFNIEDNKWRADIRVTISPRYENDYLAGYGWWCEFNGSELYSGEVLDSPEDSWIDLLSTLELAGDKNGFPS